MTNNIALEGPAPYSGLAEKLSEEQILKRAESILFKRFERSCYLTSPEATRRYLTTHFADKTREVFSLIFFFNWTNFPPTHPQVWILTNIRLYLII